MSKEIRKATGKNRTTVLREMIFSLIDDRPEITLYVAKALVLWENKMPEIKLEDFSTGFCEGAVWMANAMLTGEIDMQMFKIPKDNGEDNGKDGV